MKKRPVLSAGQYGTNLNQLQFTYDNDRGRPGRRPGRVGVAGRASHPNTEVADIVADAKAQRRRARRGGAGKISGAFNRGRQLANGSTENRGGESTLGNLVAEVQRWATQTPEAGAERRSPS